MAKNIFLLEDRDRPNHRAGMTAGFVAAVGFFVVALLSIALFALVHLAARIATPWLYLKTQEERE